MDGGVRRPRECLDTVQGGRCGLRESEAAARGSPQWGREQRGNGEDWRGLRGVQPKD